MVVAVGDANSRTVDVGDGVGVSAVYENVLRIESNSESSAVKSATMPVGVKWFISTDAVSEIGIITPRIWENT